MSGRSRELLTLVSEWRGHSAGRYANSQLTFPEVDNLSSKFSDTHFDWTTRFINNILVIDGTCTFPGESAPTFIWAVFGANRLLVAYYICEANGDCCKIPPNSSLAYPLTYEAMKRELQQHVGV